MPTRTIYIDVDQTLVDTEGNLFDNCKTQLEYLHGYGYELNAWSGGGYEYVDRILNKHHIRHLFKYVLDKPDIIVDDHPLSILEHARVVTVETKDFWKKPPNMAYKKEVY